MEAFDGLFEKRIGVTRNHCALCTGAPTGVLCDEAGVAACRIDQQACNLDAAGAAACFACERGELVDATGSCATIPGQAQTHAFSE
ncbi:MAG TPA: hypothetical protein PLD46_06430, partial [Hyphomicrobium sp.]|nr:hypothetical protein [Hyphomicrobium sp.]